MFTTRAVNGLLHVLICKYTKDNRNVMIYIKILDTLGYPLAHKIKVFCLSFYHTAYGDYCIKHIITFLHFLTAINQFKTSWNIPPYNILIDHPIFFKRLKGTLKKTLGNIFVPF